MIERSSEATDADVILATLELLHSLMAWMVMANLATPEKAAGIVEVTAKKLEQRGEVRAAQVVRHAFQGALGGEWANMKKLSQHDPGQGSA
jgi:hypothetical protein